MNKMITAASLFISISLGLSSCSNTSGNASQNAEVNTHQGQQPAATDNNASHAQQAPPPTSMDHLAQGDPSLEIPAFKFYKVKSGISFTNEDIPKGKKTAFILFDPSCGHCRTEAAALGKNYDKIKNVNIYFVSMNDPALMASFLETFAKELAGKPNVEVLYDRNQDFIQKFHVPKQFPANYVYSTTNKLQTYWDGDKNINEIIKEYTK